MDLGMLESAPARRWVFASGTTAMDTGALDYGLAQRLVLAGGAESLVAVLDSVGLRESLVLGVAEADGLGLADRLRLVSETARAVLVVLCQERPVVVLAGEQGLVLGCAAAELGVGHGDRELLLLAAATEVMIL